MLIPLLAEGGSYRMDCARQLQSLLDGRRLMANLILAEQRKSTGEARTELTDGHQLEIPENSSHTLYIPQLRLANLKCARNGKTQCEAAGKDELATIALIMTGGILYAPFPTASFRPAKQ